MTAEAVYVSKHFKPKNEAAFYRFCGLLSAWYGREVHQAWERAALPSGNWDLCLGSIVYGRAYADRFLSLGLPSLLAPGNLPALKGGSVWLLMHADEVNVRYLEERLEPLRAIGVKVTVRAIPQEVMENVTTEPNNKYWLLSAANFIHLLSAKYQGHGYHMLCPDMLYSENFFTNLKRLAQTHDAIVQGSLSATEERIAPRLPRENGAIRIAGPDLCALALDCMHDRYRQYVMNGRDDYPVQPLLLFVGERKFAKVCAHLTPFYLSHRVLMKMPVRLFNTVDADLPYLIAPEFTPYLPTMADDMVATEISAADMNYPRTEHSSLVAFIVAFWMITFCDDAYLPYLDMTTELPLPQGYIPPIPPMTDEQIAARLALVRRVVREAKPLCKDALDPEFHQNPLPQRAA